MKRAFYEWGAITASSLAMFFFGYWVVLLLTPSADVEVFFPLGHWKSTQLVANGGKITINDHYGSMLEIETVRKSSAVYPPITSQTYWAFPGFFYQSIDWNGRLKWSLQFSLLIPALFSSLAAALFIGCYLRVRREALRAFQSKSRHSTMVTAPGS